MSSWGLSDYERTTMKKYLYLFAFAILPMVFASCGDDEEENFAPQEQENGNTNPDNPNTPVVKDIIVEVDEEGNAKDGHSFTKIDDTNFYIDDIKYTASQGNLIVTGYDQAYFNGEANIITTLKYDGRTMNVTEISADAFKNCTVLTSIAIPNSVTKIGDNAFTGCTGLTSIVVDCSTIGSWFRGLSSIKEVTFGSNVTSIGGYAFAYCSGLTSIAIPNSVTSIGYDAFFGCTGLTSINIPNSVTSIGSSAFYGCTGLTSVNIPNCVTSIGGYAFADCTGLTSIKVENSNSKYDSPIPNMILVTDVMPLLRLQQTT